MEGGGGTPIKRDLITTLLEAGCTLTLVLPQAEAAGDFPSHARLQVHRLPPTRVPRRGYLTRLLAWAETTARYASCGLRTSLSAGRPDVIYGLSSVTIPAAAICGAIVRRPSVGVLLGTFLYPTLASRLRLAQSFEETIAFKTPVSRLVVLNDGTLGDRVAQALKVPPERFRFWMHGVDRRACEGAGGRSEIRAELGLPENVPLIVSASRLAGWKRVDRIIRALPKVLCHNPALLVVSGSGPARDDLERLVVDLGLAKSVRFTGPLPRDVNLRLIAAAEVFCSFHDFSNVGVSLLEALTCGAAVVVTDAGATREFVEHGVNGLVVQPDEPEAAAEAISSLLTDPELRLRLAAEGAKRAEERFLTREDRQRLELELLEELV